MVSSTGTDWAHRQVLHRQGNLSEGAPSLEVGTLAWMVGGGGGMLCSPPTTRNSSSQSQAQGCNS